MQYFRVANWETLQHYKDRNPPWIKVHNALLDDYNFSLLTDQQRFHLLAIMMLASRTDNKMPVDQKWIEQKIGATTKVNLDRLFQSRYLEKINGNQPLPNEEHCASKDLADGQQTARPETEQSRAETEHIYVQRIFDHWTMVMNKTAQTKLTEQRKTKIVARLKAGYSLEDIKRAINNCALNPHNMGQNKNQTLYNDIELICRNDTKLEYFRDQVGAGNDGRPTTEHILKDTTWANGSDQSAIRNPEGDVSDVSPGARSGSSETPVGVTIEGDIGPDDPEDG